MVMTLTFYTVNIHQWTT